MTEEQPPPKKRKPQPPRPPGWYSKAARAERAAKRERQKEQRRKESRGVMLEARIRTLRQAKTIARNESTAAALTPVVERIQAKAAAQRTAEAEAAKAAKKRKAAVPAPGRDGRVQELRNAGDPTMPPDHRPKLDLRVDPLTWLDRRNMLRDPASTPLTPRQRAATAAAAMYRAEAGRQGVGLFQRAATSGMKSPTLEPQSRGGGGTTISESKVHAIREIGRLRASMPARLFKTLEAVLVRDEWLWEGRERRGPVYEQIRCALDCLAVHRGLMRRDDLFARWPALRKFASKRRREAIAKRQAGEVG